MSLLSIGAVTRDKNLISHENTIKKYNELPQDQVSMNTTKTMKDYNAILAKIKETLNNMKDYNIKVLASILEYYSYSDRAKLILKLKKENIDLRKLADGFASIGKPYLGFELVGA